MIVRASVRALVVGGLALTVALVFALMAVFGVGLFQRETAEFRGKTGQIERVQGDPGYRIAAYDRFYDICAAVQTKETAIRSQQAMLGRALEQGLSQTRIEQLNANLAALETTRAQLINNYNADARKEDTRANFRASDLPYQLSTTTTETTCTVE